MDPQTEKRLISLEARLSKIENYLKLAPSSGSSVKSPEAAAPFKAEKKPSEVTTGSWLAIVAVICFVLAGAFIVKLSIDSGWLTPIRQAGLAALLGLSLIATGVGLLRSDREYASFLPGAGVVILYLTTFAAYRYYALISFEAAIGLTAVVSGICIGLYQKIRHDIYPLTAAAGAYLAPIVLGFTGDMVFSVYYFLICSVAFVMISIWMQTRILVLVASYLALVMTACAGLEAHQDVLVAAALGLNFLIFACGTYLYTRANKKPLTQQEAWAFFPVLLIFYAAEYFYIDRIQPGLAPWASLGFAAVLLGFYGYARVTLQGQAKTIRPVILAYAALAAFHSIYLELLPHDIQPWLFVAIMVAFAAASHTLVKSDEGESFYVPAATLIAIAAIEYISMIDHLLNGYNTPWIRVSVAAAASLWLALIFSDKSYLARRNAKIVFLGAVNILSVLALYRLTADYNSLAVSASWLLYAICVMLYAVARKDKTIAKSALMVLSFAAAKALLHDAASAPTIIRIFCLLLTGAVLYGCGLFIRRITGWEDGVRVKK